MLPFSIDFLTRDDDAKREDSGSDHSFRSTPSPTDSVLSSAPSDAASANSEEAESIAQVLLSLDTNAKRDTGSNEQGSKPSHSYIALISMAILSSPEKKMLLCDIYQYIMDNFVYYNNKEKAWRNSIRHNLSLNECFIKNGRADNGKGNYWSIHPACEDDFSRGDFRRRHARRRARKSMKDVSVSDLPMNFRYNMGYVPMTSSPIGYHPYSPPSLYYPGSPFSCAATPTTPSLQVGNFFPTHQNIPSMQSYGNVALHGSTFPGW